MYAPKEKYDTAEDFALTVFDAWTFAKDNNRADREKYWRRNHLLYNNKTDLTQFKQTLSAMPYEDQLNIPTAFQQVEGTMPMVCTALLGNNPMVRVKPREKGDRAASMATNALLDYQFEEDLDIRTRLPLLLRDSLIYDTKIAHVGWKVEEYAAGKRYDPHGHKFVAPKVRRFDTKPPDRSETSGTIVEEDSKAKPRGHPVLIGIPRWDFYEDPLGTDINGGEGACRFVQWRRVMTPDQLKDWVEGTRAIGETEARQKGIEPRPGLPWNMTNCKRAYKMTGTVNTTNDFGRRLLQESGLRGAYQPGDHDDRLLEVLCHYEDEVWGVIIPNATGIGGEGKSGPMTLLRDVNPYWHGKKPFVAFRYVQLDNQFDGKSLLDVLRDMIHEKNTRRQQRMDEVTRRINSFLFYNAAQVNSTHLVSRTGGPVPVRGIPSQAVHTFRTEPVAPEAYQEVGMLDEEIAQTSGLTPDIRGMGEQQTARGTAMWIQQGTNRFKLTVHMYARAMREIAVMVHELDRQFLPAEGVARMVGRTKAGGWQFTPWTLNDINRNYDLEFTCSPEEANQGMWQQALTNTLAVLSQADARMPFLDWPEIGLASFESLGYKGDSERFMLEDMEDADLENALFLKTGTMPMGAPGDPNKHITKHMELMSPDAMSRLAQDVDPVQAIKRLQAHMNDHGEKAQPQGGGGGMPQPQGQPMQQPMPQGAPR